VEHAAVRSRSDDELHVILEESGPVNGGNVTLAQVLDLEGVHRFQDAARALQERIGWYRERDRATNARRKGRARRQRVTQRVGI